MTQYQVETKNQVSGEWNLWDRYVAKPEAVAVAAHVNRKRPLSALPVVAFIETRVVEVTNRPSQDSETKIIWENGAFVAER